MRLFDLDEAIKLLRGKCVAKYPTTFLVGLFAAADELSKLPEVDAKPVVHGRWVNWGKSGTPTYENYGTCSVCHEDAEICTEHRNYCPNCGAQMDGGIENGAT